MSESDPMPGFDTVPTFAHNNTAPWMADGRCVGADPEAWFPPPSAGLRHPDAQVAVAVCSGCPVRVACYEMGHTEGLHGIWGGVLIHGGTPTVPRARPTTVTQRRYNKNWRRIARERGLTDTDPRHGTVHAYANLGCRCEPCREAARVKEAARRERRSAREKARRAAKLAAPRGAA